MLRMNQMAWGVFTKDLEVIKSKINDMKKLVPAALVSQLHPTVRHFTKSVAFYALLPIPACPGPPNKK